MSLYAARTKYRKTYTTGEIIQNVKGHELRALLEYICADDKMFTLQEVFASTSLVAIK